MPPRRLRVTKFKEFEIVVARLSSGACEAVAYDSDSNIVAKAMGVEPDQAETGVREDVLKRTSEFFGYDAAINTFLRAFPEGFQDAYYAYRERQYKEADRAKVLELFDPKRIRALADTGHHDEIAQRFLRALQRSNLLATQEIVGVKNALQSHETRRNVATAAIKVHDDALAFMDGIVAALPRQAARWPVATYLPFFLFPEQHMFLKPSVTTKFADRLGRDLRYQPTPNAATYQALLSLVAETHEELLRAGHAPRDNIDVQSFIWAIAHDGYIANAVKERESGAWLRQS